ncbi:cytochrome P450 [Amycolatopsis oliviviridis]|uniref:Cytochrome P450 n=1 Tax=Amycolatopsis oliviviridis TaxID=1471590 RepID=A0ABQ3LPB9_9PSEU|nr:cytochrome P450 [Amycolatopsis oliviviridis]GHH22456.1 cytochrome P450 [Amycolatopsis oliviviridis]
MISSPEIVDLSDVAEDLYRDPYAVLAALRARGPAHFVRLPNGSEVWLIVGYDEALAALGDPTLIKNWLRATGRIGPGAIGANMISSDPPDHTRLRRLVSREFTARRVAALVPRVEAIAVELLDRMDSGAGPHDLIAGFAFPLPVAVISELLGVPFLDRTEFSGLCGRIMASAGDATSTEKDIEEINRYFDGLIERKRADPGEDLLSALIRVTDEDADRLSHAELRATTFLLLVAGHVTSTNLIANGVLALLDHPDQLAALRADWELLPRAVEEILRYDGPQPFSTRRFTTTHWPVGDSGTVIPPGETVMIALAAASHDPARFPRAGDFDIHRTTPGHLAFGHGIHYCLGAPLARVQVSTALRVLLNRFPALSLSCGADRSWRRTLISRGVTDLPVLLR